MRFALNKSGILAPMRRIVAPTLEEFRRQWKVSPSPDRDARRYRDYCERKKSSERDRARLAIAFDTSSNAGTSSSTSTLSWTGTANAGADFAVFAMLARDGADASSISWNGSTTGITKAVSKVATNGLVVSIWYLIAPAIGSFTVQINTSGQSWIGGVMATYSGILQASPVDVTNSLETVSVNPAAFTGFTTATNGCLVVDGISTNQSTAASVSMTAVTNRLERKRFLVSGGRTVAMSDILPQVTAGATTMGWTVGAGINSCYCGVSFKPALSAKLFRKSSLNGLGAGGPFFHNPLAG